MTGYQLRGPGFNSRHQPLQRHHQKHLPGHPGGVIGDLTRSPMTPFLKIPILRLSRVPDRFPVSGCTFQVILGVPSETSLSHKVADDALFEIWYAENKYW
ncbi:tRNA-2-methylthio-N(6)-dimethylallyladenosine synthase [Frankliniella fusca]|uniref:tRNA-2-methylthio-N(6)-dimethylallyladenosine synthase n=1 Tax=Frankliniella fusca TaxID=407009 RepID=A0AAE1I2J2_9NEOP|nr:tRNA-2-methylthio-N(6)-dimethylallyladenosine synthase [Frankliniella fusca]